MSNRKTKKSQKLGSSRRNRNRTFIEEKENDDGFPDAEEHDSEQSQLHTVSENQASNESSLLHSDQPVVCTNPNTSLFEPSHSQPQDVKDLLAQAEVTSKKRKMGSTRKGNRNLKFEETDEGEPEYRVQLSEGIHDEHGVAVESSIKEDWGKEHQTNLLDCAPSQASEHEISIQQGDQLAIGTIMHNKDGRKNDEHQHLEAALQSKPVDISSSELNQFKEADNDKPSMAEHAVLKTEDDQSSLKFISRDIQDDKQDNEDTMEGHSVADIGQEIQGQEVTGSASFINEHHQVWKNVTNEASTEDENTVDLCLQHKEDTIKVTKEHIHKPKSTEFRENIDEYKEVSEVYHTTDNVSDEGVAATRLNQAMEPEIDIISCLKLKDPKLETSLDQFLSYEVKYPCGSEIKLYGEEQYDLSEASWTGESGAHEVIAKKVVDMHYDEEEKYREIGTEREVGNTGLQSTTSNQLLFSTNMLEFITVSELIPPETLHGETETSNLQCYPRFSESLDIKEPEAEQTDENVIESQEYNETQQYISSKVVNTKQECNVLDKKDEETVMVENICRGVATTNLVLSDEAEHPVDTSVLEMQSRTEVAESTVHEQAILEGGKEGQTVSLEDPEQNSYPDSWAQSKSSKYTEFVTVTINTGHPMTSNELMDAGEVAQLPEADIQKTNTTYVEEEHILINTKSSKRKMGSVRRSLGRKREEKDEEEVMHGEEKNMGPTDSSTTSSPQTTIEHPSPAKEHHDFKKDDENSIETIERTNAEFQTQTKKKKKIGSTRRPHGRHQLRAGEDEGEWKDQENTEEIEHQIITQAPTSNLLTESQSTMNEESHDIHDSPTEQTQIIKSSDKIVTEGIDIAPVILSNKIDQIHTVVSREVSNAEALTDIELHKEKGVNEVKDAESTVLNEQVTQDDIFTEHVLLAAKKHGNNSLDHESVNEVNVHFTCDQVELIPETHVMSDMEIDTEDIHAFLSEQNQNISKEHLEDPANRVSEPEQQEITSTFVQIQESKSSQHLDQTDTNTEVMEEENNETEEGLNAGLTEDFTKEDITTVHSQQYVHYELSSQTTDLGLTTMDNSSPATEHPDFRKDDGNSIETIENTNAEIQIQTKKKTKSGSTSEIEHHIITQTPTSNMLTETQNTVSEESHDIHDSSLCFTEHVSLAVKPHGTESPDHDIASEVVDFKKDDEKSIENMENTNVGMHSETKKKKRFGSTQRPHGSHQPQAEGEEEWKDLENKDIEHQPHGTPVTSEEELIIKLEDETVTGGIDVAPATASTEDQNHTVVSDEVSNEEGLTDIIEIYEKPRVNEEKDAKSAVLNKQEIQHDRFTEHVSPAVKKQDNKKPDHESVREVNVHFTSDQMELISETQVISDMEMDRENIHAFVSEQNQNISEEHLEDPANRESEAEQKESTSTFVQIQESKSSQDLDQTGNNMEVIKEEINETEEGLNAGLTEDLTKEDIATVHSQQYMHYELSAQTTDLGLTTMEQPSPATEHPDFNKDDGNSIETIENTNAEIQIQTKKKKKIGSTRRPHGRHQLRAGEDEGDWKDQENTEEIEHQIISQAPISNLLNESQSTMSEASLDIHESPEKICEFVAEQNQNIFEEHLEDPANRESEAEQKESTSRFVQIQESKSSQDLDQTGNKMEVIMEENNETEEGPNAGLTEDLTKEDIATVHSQQYMHYELSAQTIDLGLTTMEQPSPATEHPDFNKDDGNSIETIENTNAEIQIQTKKKKKIGSTRRPHGRHQLRAGEDEGEWKDQENTEEIEHQIITQAPTSNLLNESQSTMSKESQDIHDSPEKICEFVSEQNQIISEEHLEDPANRESEAEQQESTSTFVQIQESKSSQDLDQTGNNMEVIKEENNETEEGLNAGLTEDLTKEDIATVHSQQYMHYELSAQTIDLGLTTMEQPSPATEHPDFNKDDGNSIETIENTNAEILIQTKKKKKIGSTRRPHGRHQLRAGEDEGEWKDQGNTEEIEHQIITQAPTSNLLSESQSTMSKESQDIHDSPEKICEFVSEQNQNIFEEHLEDPANRESEAEQKESTSTFVQIQESKSSQDLDQTGNNMEVIGEENNETEEGLNAGLTEDLTKEDIATVHSQQYMHYELPAQTTDLGLTTMEQPSPATAHPDFNKDDGNSIETIEKTNAEIQIQTKKKKKIGSTRRPHGRHQLRAGEDEGEWKDQENTEEIEHQIITQAPTSNLLNESQSTMSEESQDIHDSPEKICEFVSEQNQNIFEEHLEDPANRESEAEQKESTSTFVQIQESKSSQDLDQTGNKMEVIKEENNETEEGPNAGLTEDLTKEDIATVHSQQYMHYELSAQTIDLGLTTMEQPSPATEHPDFNKDDGNSIETIENTNAEIQIQTKKKKKIGSTRRPHGRHQLRAGEDEGEWKDQENTEEIEHQIITQAPTSNLLNESQSTMSKESQDIHDSPEKICEFVSEQNQIISEEHLEDPANRESEAEQQESTSTFVQIQESKSSQDLNQTGNNMEVIKEENNETEEGLNAGLTEDLTKEDIATVHSQQYMHYELSAQTIDLGLTTMEQPSPATEHPDFNKDDGNSIETIENTNAEILIQTKKKKKIGSTRRPHGRHQLRAGEDEGEWKDQGNTEEIEHQIITQAPTSNLLSESQSTMSKESQDIHDSPEKICEFVSEQNQNIFEEHLEDPANRESEAEQKESTSTFVQIQESKSSQDLDQTGNNMEVIGEENNETEEGLNAGLTEDLTKEDIATVHSQQYMHYELPAQTTDLGLTTMEQPSPATAHPDFNKDDGNSIETIEKTNAEIQIQTKKKKKIGSTRRPHGRDQLRAGEDEGEWKDQENTEEIEHQIITQAPTSNLLNESQSTMSEESQDIHDSPEKICEFVAEQNQNIFEEHLEDPANRESEAEKKESTNTFVQIQESKSSQDLNQTGNNMEVIKEENNETEEGLNAGLTEDLTKEDIATVHSQQYMHYELSAQTTDLGLTTMEQPSPATAHPDFNKDDGNSIETIEKTNAEIQIQTKKKKKIGSTRRPHGRHQLRAGEDEGEWKDQENTEEIEHQIITQAPTSNLLNESQSTMSEESQDIHDSPEKICEFVAEQNQNIFEEHLEDPANRESEAEKKESTNTFVQIQESKSSQDLDQTGNNMEVIKEENNETEEGPNAGLTEDFTKEDIVTVHSEQYMHYELSAQTIDLGLTTMEQPSPATEHPDFNKDDGNSIDTIENTNAEVQIQTKKKKKIGSTRRPHGRHQLRAGEDEGEWKDQGNTEEIEHQIITQAPTSNLLNESQSTMSEESQDIHDLPEKICEFVSEQNQNIFEEHLEDPANRESEAEQKESTSTFVQIQESKSSQDLDQTGNNMEVIKEENNETEEGPNAGLTEDFTKEDIVTVHSEQYMHYELSAQTIDLGLTTMEQPSPATEHPDFNKDDGNSIETIEKTNAEIQIQTKKKKKIGSTRRPHGRHQLRAGEDEGEWKDQENIEEIEHQIITQAPIPNLLNESQSTMSEASLDIHESPEKLSEFVSEQNQNISEEHLEDPANRESEAEQKESTSTFVQIQESKSSQDLDQTGNNMEVIKEEINETEEGLNAGLTEDLTKKDIATVHSQQYMHYELSAQTTDLGLTTMEQPSPATVHPDFNKDDGNRIETTENTNAEIKIQTKKKKKIGSTRRPHGRHQLRAGEDEGEWKDQENIEEIEHQIITQAPIPNLLNESQSTMSEESQHIHDSPEKICEFVSEQNQNISEEHLEDPANRESEAEQKESTSTFAQIQESKSSQDLDQTGYNMEVIKEENNETEEGPNAGLTIDFTKEDIATVHSEQYMHYELSAQTTDLGLTTMEQPSPATEHPDFNKDDGNSIETIEKTNAEIQIQTKKKKKIGSTRRPHGRHQLRAAEDEGEWKDQENTEETEHQIITQAPTSNLLTETQCTMSEASLDMHDSPVTAEQRHVIKSEAEIVTGGIKVAPVVFDDVSNTEGLTDIIEIHEKPGINDEKDVESMLLNEQDIQDVTSTEHMSLAVKNDGIESSDHESDSKVGDFKKDNEKSIEAIEKTNVGIHTQTKKKKKIGSTRRPHGRHQLHGGEEEGEWKDQENTEETEHQIITQAPTSNLLTESQSTMSEESQNIYDSPENIHAFVSEQNQIISEEHLEHPTNRESQPEQQESTSTLVQIQKSKSSQDLDQTDTNAKVMEEEKNETDEGLNAGLTEDFTKEDIATVHSQQYMHYELSSQTNDLGLTTMEQPSPATAHPDFRKDDGNSIETIENTNAEILIQTKKKKKMGSTRRPHGRHQLRAEGEEEDGKDLENTEAIEHQIITQSPSVNLLTESQSTVSEESHDIHDSPVTTEQKQRIKSEAEIRTGEMTVPPSILSIEVDPIKTVVFNEVNNPERLTDIVEINERAGENDKKNAESMLLNKQEIQDGTFTEHVSQAVKEHGIKRPDHESPSKVGDFKKDYESSIETMEKLNVEIQIQTKKKKKIGSTRRPHGRHQLHAGEDEGEWKDQENTEEIEHQIVTQAPISSLLTESQSTMSEESQDIYDSPEKICEFVAEQNQNISEENLEDPANRKSEAEQQESTSTFVQIQESSQDLDQTDTNAEVIEEEKNETDEGIEAGLTEDFTKEDIATVHSQQYMHYELPTQTTDLGLILMEQPSPATVHPDFNKDDGNSIETIEKTNAEILIQTKKKKKMGSTRRPHGRHQLRAEGEEEDWKDQENTEAIEHQIITQAPTSNLLTETLNTVSEESHDIHDSPVTTEQKQFIKSEAEISTGGTNVPPTILSIEVDQIKTVVSNEVSNAEGLTNIIEHHDKPGMNEEKDAESMLLNEQEIQDGTFTEHVSLAVKKYGNESPDHENSSKVGDFKKDYESSIKTMEKSNVEIHNQTKKKKKIGSTRRPQGRHQLRAGEEEGEWKDQENTDESEHQIITQAPTSNLLTESQSTMSEESQNIYDSPENIHAFVSEQNQIMSEEHLEHPTNRESQPEQQESTSTLVQIQESKSSQDLDQTDTNAEVMEEEKNETAKGLNAGLTEDFTKEDIATVHSQQYMHYELSSQTSDLGLTTVEQPTPATDHPDFNKDDGNSIDTTENTNAEIQIQTKKKKKMGSTRRLHGRHQLRAGEEEDWKDLENMEETEHQIITQAPTSNMLTETLNTVSEESHDIHDSPVTTEQKQFIESEAEIRTGGTNEPPTILSIEVDQIKTVVSNEVSNAEGLTNIIEHHDKPGMNEDYQNNVEIVETMNVEINTQTKKKKKIGSTRRPHGRHQLHAGGEEGEWKDLENIEEIQIVDQAASSNLFTELQNVMSDLLPDTIEPSFKTEHGMTHTENENANQTAQSSHNPMELIPETQDRLDIKVASKEYHTISEEHLDNPKNRESEPESTCPDVHIQELKLALGDMATQNSGHSNSGRKKKIGSTRRSLRVMKGKENTQEQTTEEDTLTLVQDHAKTETILSVEISHQSMPSHPEPLNIVEPETENMVSMCKKLDERQSKQEAWQETIDISPRYAEDIDREYLKTVRKEDKVNTDSNICDTETKVQEYETQIYKTTDQSETSLLSEIEFYLNKSFESTLSTTGLNLNITDFSKPVSEGSLQLPSSQNPQVHKEPSSPARRRKMGSSRKISRNKNAEIFSNQDSKSEQEKENLDKNNDEPNREAKTVQETVMVEETKDVKEFTQCMSEVNTLSQINERSTQATGQPLPEARRKFGSRRTAKGSGGLGAFTHGDYESNQDDLRVSESESTLTSQPASEPRLGIKDTNTSTKAGLVFLDDSKKMSPCALSTGGRPKIDFEQWKEQLPDFGQAVYNIVLVGNSNVGKTSFIKRLQSGQFIPDYSATVGVDTFVQTVTFGNRTVKLYVWDTAGQERYHSIARQVFHKAQGLLLMYDITSIESFHAVRAWISQVQENAPPDVILMLVGNKNDCANRKVELQNGEDLSNEYNIHFMECSAATGENVSETLKTLAWLLVKQSVRKEEEHITLQPKPQNKKSGCC